MGNQTTLTVSLLMAALFSIAIIGFAIGFANDNNSYVNIKDNYSDFDTRTRTSFDQFKEDSNDTYSSIVSTTIEPGSDVIRSSGSFTITWSNVFSVFKNIITLAFESIFGSSGPFAVFFTAFIAIIGFLFALYIIKTWRGNP
jgi:hypothetical protein